MLDTGLFFLLQILQWLLKWFFPNSKEVQSSLITSNEFFVYRRGALTQRDKGIIFTFMSIGIQLMPIGKALFLGSVLSFKSLLWAIVFWICHKTKSHINCCIVSLWRSKKIVSYHLWVVLHLDSKGLILSVAYTFWKIYGKMKTCCLSGTIILILWATWAWVSKHQFSYN